MFLLQASFFAVAHIFYAVYFLRGAWFRPSSLAAALLLCAAVAVAASRIIPAVGNPTEHGAVVVYAVLITLMCASSFFWKGKGRGWYIAGALLFLISDVFLAWNRFVRPFTWSSVAVLSCYWAAQALLDAGLEVRCCGVPGMPEALPTPADFVILPFPALQGERLRGTAAPERTAVFACCRRGTRVYGGGLSPLRQALLDCGAEPVELFGTEPLTTHNAVPTAEGAIALAVLHSPYRLHGAPCLVIGYGHIGRVLANKLHGLSARVTVAARRPSDRAAAEALGLEADETGRYARGLAYHFVFNTVPAPVLTQDQLAALLPGCLLVELASAPGGIPACTRTDVTRIDAPGLPGRFCPASAGAAYAAAILEQEGAFPA